MGQLLSGRYKVLRPLGAGGMGQTYVAEDTQRPGNPVCVVKQLKPPTNDPSFLAIAKRLFNKEAETLEQLGHHNQIPQLLAYFEHEQDFFLVQDFVEGHPLSQELGQRWPEEQVIQFLEEALTILDFVHSQNVIHRDIKPDNIIRRQKDAKLVLIDFGAVKQVRSQNTVLASQASQSVAVGTPGYMPSEQVSGHPPPSLSWSSSSSSSSVCKACCSTIHFCFACSNFLVRSANSCFVLCCCCFLNFLSFHIL